MLFQSVELKQKPASFEYLVPPNSLLELTSREANSFGSCAVLPFPVWCGRCLEGTEAASRNANVPSKDTVTAFYAFWNSMEDQCSHFVLRAS
jgi:hypothetical protein